MTAGEVDSLVEQIADLDAKYERDEIDERDYVAKRRELKGRLMEALNEEGSA